MIHSKRVRVGLFLFFIFLNLNSFGDVGPSMTIASPASPPESTPSAQSPELETTAEDSSEMESTIPLPESIVDHSDLTGLDENSVHWFASYFGIFNGPAVRGPSIYQPSSSGKRDLTRPIEIKNFFTLGYAFDQDWGISGTSFIDWQRTASPFSFSDPFARVYNAHLIHLDRWNLYSDLRFHFPVSAASREADLLAGIQTFQSLTWDTPTPFTLGVNASIRANYFGRQGIGNDIELYLAPNLSYSFSSKFAFTLMYEMGASHTHHYPFAFDNEGTDLEPGILWEASSHLTVNPFLTLYTGDHISSRSTAVGMYINYDLI